MASLFACPGCSRHLKRTETACPFCGADVREAIAKAVPRPMPTERLGRTALMAFAAANIGIAGCGGETSGPAPGPETGGSVAQPHYGAPPPPPTGGTPGLGGSNAGGAPSTGGSMANTGGVIIAPPYGIAPIPDGGGPYMPLYGGGHLPAKP